MKYNSIILSGLPLSGNSTLAKSLSEIFHLKLHSIGELFKLEWKKQHPNQEIPFEQYWKNISIEENKKVDEYTRRLFENENLIGEFRYSISYKKLNVLLVLLVADLNIRIQRAMLSGRYKGKSPQEIESILQKREQDEVYMGKQIYGSDYDFRDPKNYHLVINSGKITLGDSIKIIKSAM